VTLIRIFEEDIARQRKVDPLLFRSRRRGGGDGQCSQRLIACVTDGM
jgi:hypothetical protein